MSNDNTKSQEQAPDTKPADELKKAQGELKKKADELKAAEAVIADLKQKYDEAKKESAESTKEVVVKHGNARYKAVIPSFRLDGKVYSAASLKEDKAMVARLVKIRSGVLQKIDG